MFNCFHFSGARIKYSYLVPGTCPSQRGRTNAPEGFPREGRGLVHILFDTCSLTAVDTVSQRWAYQIYRLGVTTPGSHPWEQPQIHTTPFFVASNMGRFPTTSQTRSHCVCTTEQPEEGLLAIICVDADCSYSVECLDI